MTLCLSWLWVKTTIFAFSPARKDSFLLSSVLGNGPGLIFTGCLNILLGMPSKTETLLFVFLHISVAAPWCLEILLVCLSYIMYRTICSFLLMTAADSQINHLSIIQISILGSHTVRQFHFISNSYIKFDACGTSTT